MKRANKRLQSAAMCRADEAVRAYRDTGLQTDPFGSYTGVPSFVDDHTAESAANADANGHYGTQIGGTMATPEGRDGVIPPPGRADAGWGHGMFDEEEYLAERRFTLPVQDADDL